MTLWYLIFTSVPLRVSNLIKGTRGDLVFDLKLDNAASRFVANKPFSTDVGSTRVVRRVKEWLAECEDEHQNCLISKSPRLPSRVIYVGHESQDIRLYESSPGETGKYIALSYCWGGPQTVTTTRDTLDRYTTRLDVSSLPQTICDAILTTRRLGFCYLWVDALCIVQDWAEDRTKEILSMGDVYKNAFLTIIAANNPTVTAGFLNSRPSPETCTLSFSTPDGETGAISLTPKLYGLQPKEPLYKRAWALQEFLLSPRLLVFGTYEATYQCNSAISPIIPNHRSYDPNWPCKRIESIFKRLPTYGSEKAEPDETALRHRRTIWQSIVHDYTTRTLTVPADRLPALAGISKELESAWQDRYIAGMWRSDLFSWLLWRSDSLTTAPLDTAWRAPSWSWASVDGTITFHWTGGKISGLSAKILDIDSTPHLYNGCLGQKLILEAVIMQLDKVRGMREGDKRNAPKHIRDEDDENMEDDGTLKFVLLGFNYLSAFGLIVREVSKIVGGEEDDRIFERIGMLCSWLPKEVKWWPKRKRRVVIM